MSRQEVGGAFDIITEIAEMLDNDAFVTSEHHSDGDDGSADKMLIGGKNTRARIIIGRGTMENRF